MADDALNNDEEALASARVRTNRTDSCAAHQKVNNIKVGEVVSVAHELVVVSAETAKTLNPACRRVSYVIYAATRVDVYKIIRAYTCRRV